MERAGVSVNADLLREVSKSLGAQIAALETDIFAIAGEKFSVGSTKQLQEVLFDKLKLPIGKKTKTGYSTGAEVLEDLASKGHDIARKGCSVAGSREAEVYLCRRSAGTHKPGDGQSAYVAEPDCCQHGPSVFQQP